MKNFISHDEGTKLIKDINKILEDTAFPAGRFNPALYIPGALGTLPAIYNYLIADEENTTFKPLPLLVMMILIMLPYGIFFSAMAFRYMEQKDALLGYIKAWNRKSDNGVSIALFTEKTAKFQTQSENSPPEGFYSFYVASRLEYSST